MIHLHIHTLTLTHTHVHAHNTYYTAIYTYTHSHTDACNPPCMYIQTLTHPTDTHAAALILAQRCVALAGNTAYTHAAALILAQRCVALAGNTAYTHAAALILAQRCVALAGNTAYIHLLFAPVITVACERSLPFCQKCSGWQVTAIHMCTLPTLHIYRFAHCPCYHSSMWKSPAILPKVQRVAGYS